MSLELKLDVLRLEPPFYLPEIVRQRLPWLTDGDHSVKIDDLDSDALCEALNTALRESIQAQEL